METKAIDIVLTILLACLLALPFSIYGERVPFDRTQNEGWVISGGDFGTPIPHEGGEGQMDAFVFVKEMAETEQEQPTEATTEEAFPITVTVEKEKYTRPTWEYVLDGVAITLIVEVIVLGIAAVVLYRKTHRRMVAICKRSN